jgi:hypothetical protein
MRTYHLHNTNPERYRYPNPFGFLACVRLSVAQVGMLSAEGLNINFFPVM